MYAKIHTDHTYANTCAYAVPTWSWHTWRINISWQSYVNLCNSSNKAHAKLWLEQPQVHDEAIQDAKTALLQTVDSFTCPTLHDGSAMRTMG